MPSNPSPSTRQDLDELAGYLAALGNPGRLELLRQLRVPRAVSEIHIKASRGGPEHNPDRPVSRNAVDRHLSVLKAIGVVGSRPGSRDGRTMEEYFLQHTRLFQVVEELRGLTQLRPVEPMELDVTVQDSPRVRAKTAEGPHLTLLSGPLEGRIHHLGGSGPWEIGRATSCDVPLDHDPYASGAHARLEAGADGFRILDLPTNRNGTLLNWHPVPRGRSASLRTGDVIRIGRTLILFHAQAE